MVVPKFGLFINLSGAFACTALAFILPVMMYSSLFKEELSKCRKYFHIFVIVFGTLCGSISFVVSCIDIVEAFGGGGGEIEAVSEIQSKVNSTTPSLPQIIATAQLMEDGGSGVTGSL